jgi:hypothetical protein
MAPLSRMVLDALRDADRRDPQVGAEAKATLDKCSAWLSCWMGGANGRRKRRTLAKESRPAEQFPRLAATGPEASAPLRSFVRARTQTNWRTRSTVHEPPVTLRAGDGQFGGMV